MKIKFSPGLAYVLGVWCGRGTKEGVGVEGQDELRSAFLTSCFSLGYASPDKVQIRERSVHFYHSALKAGLQKLKSERVEKLRYRNDYSSSYFAGLFDAVGGFDSGKPVFAFSDKMDEIVLLRLGFRVKKAGRKLIVISDRELLSFIKGKLKVMNG